MPRRGGELARIKDGLENYKPGNSTYVLGQPKPRKMFDLFMSNFDLVTEAPGLQQREGCIKPQCHPFHSHTWAGLVMSFQAQKASDGLWARIEYCDRIE